MRMVMVTTARRQRRQFRDDIDFFPGEDVEERDSKQIHADVLWVDVAHQVLPLLIAVRMSVATWPDKRLFAGVNVHFRRAAVVFDIPDMHAICVPPLVAAQVCRDGITRTNGPDFLTV